MSVMGTVSVSPRVRVVVTIAVSVMGCVLVEVTSNDTDTRAVCDRVMESVGGGLMVAVSATVMVEKCDVVCVAFSVTVGLRVNVGVVGGEFVSTRVDVIDDNTLAESDALTTLIDVDSVAEIELVGLTDRDPVLEGLGVGERVAEAVMVCEQECPM